MAGSPLDQGSGACCTTSYGSNGAPAARRHVGARPAPRTSRYETRDLAAEFREHHRSQSRGRAAHGMPASRRRSIPAARHPAERSSQPGPGLARDSTPAPADLAAPPPELFFPDPAGALPGRGRTAMTDTKPCVFIHTNHKQIVGALVAEYSFKRNSKHAERFDVRIIHTEDYPFFTRARGPGVPPRRRSRRLALRGPAVLHPAPLHAAGADGLRGPGRGRRSRRLRGGRRVGAAVSRHAGQGDHVPPALRQQGDAPAASPPA